MRESPKKYVVPMVRAGTALAVMAVGLGASHCGVDVDHDHLQALKDGVFDVACTALAIWVSPLSVPKRKPNGSESGKPQAADRRA